MNRRETQGGPSRPTAAGILAGGAPPAYCWDHVPQGWFGPTLPRMPRTCRLGGKMSLDMQMAHRGSVPAAAGKQVGKTEDKKIG